MDGGRDVYLGICILVCQLRPFVSAASSVIWFWGPWTAHGTRKRKAGNVRAAAVVPCSRRFYLR
ncbi:hypothetical protein LX32DRAFT_116252 [Colletotrichum zoysiae]|uniref:Uncharacterized protein n=1 Tax=Colletotrichum zoysiae TaxID=1216348 RepID=A0AAD9HRV1_9PEZI|nr:hypothetical protein LX32DRAFT_116252 [Colletotrichum zoysiae]